MISYSSSRWLPSCICVCWCDDAFLYVRAQAVMTPKVGSMRIHTGARYVPQIRFEYGRDHRQQRNIDKWFSRHFLGPGHRKKKSDFLLHSQCLLSFSNDKAKFRRRKKKKRKKHAHTHSLPGRFTNCSPFHWLFASLLTASVAVPSLTVRFII